MIYLFLANGFEEVEALAPLDILRRAGLEVTTVGVGGEEIQGKHGIVVRADLPDSMFRDSAPEAVILPGGLPGADNLAASRIVREALLVAQKNGGLLCAICAAPYILADNGYLKDKRATCYPGYEDQLRQGGAIVQEPTERVVSDGNVITAKGMGVGLEFGFAIAERFVGKEKTDALRHATIAD